MRLFFNFVSLLSATYAAAFFALAEGYFTEYPHLESLRWVSFGVFVSLFVFSIFLSFRWGRMDSERKKREEELSDLIMILKEGRKDQLAVINSLRTKASEQFLTENAKEEENVESETDSD